MIGRGLAEHWMRDAPQVAEIGASHRVDGIWSPIAWCSGRWFRGVLVANFVYLIGPVELSFRHPYGPAVFLGLGRDGEVTARVAEDPAAEHVNSVASAGDGVATCSRFGPALAG
jgi:hypothetical protein